MTPLVGGSSSRVGSAQMALGILPTLDFGGEDVYSVCAAFQVLEGGQTAGGILVRYAIRLIELSLLAAFLVVAGLSSSQAADDENGQGWMPFKESNGHIAFDVRVNGQAASAIFDTGADASVISEGLARRAEINLNRGDSIRLVGIHGQGTIPTSRRFTLEMAGQEVELDRVPVAPAPGFDVVFGRPMAESSVVQIDYPNQRIRFIRRDALEFERNVELRNTRRGAPMVRARFLETDQRQQLKTGNAGAHVLKRKVVR